MPAHEFLNFEHACQQNPNAYEKSAPRFVGWRLCEWISHYSIYAQHHTSDISYHCQQATKYKTRLLFGKMDIQQKQLICHSRFYQGDVYVFFAPSFLQSSQLCFIQHCYIFIAICAARVRWAG